MDRLPQQEQGGPKGKPEAQALGCVRLWSFEVQVCGAHHRHHAKEDERQAHQVVQGVQ